MPTNHKRAIAAFREGLGAEALETVDALRALIAAADERLVEDFKWSAPSFKLAREHRVTLGIERKGGVRIVLHRGVSKKDTSQFLFDDPDKLATWPAKDRGVLVLRSGPEVAEKHEALTSLIRRWLDVPM